MVGRDHELARVMLVLDDALAGSGRRARSSCRSGRPAAALGHLDGAAGDLQTAISICDANGARGCAVQARAELAAALIRRHAQGDLA